MPSQWPTDEQGRPIQPSPSSNMMHISDELVRAINTPIEQPDNQRHDGDGIWGERQGDRIKVYIDWEALTPDEARHLAKWLLGTAEQIEEGEGRA